MFCGSDGPTATYRWATNRQACLQQFLLMGNGVLSRDCIPWLLMALNPQAFQKCFQNSITDAIQTDNSGPKQLIAIDVKTCRRSHDASQHLSVLHIVRA
jgi:hypothetical protein